MGICVSIIWVVFGVIFLMLAVFHFRQSATELSVDLSGVVKKINGIPVQEGLCKFVKSFNESNKKINSNAAYGYSAAFLTTIVSFLLHVGVL